MKALITGGAGFIGYHLACELIAQGYDVVIVDNFRRGVNDSYLAKIIQNDHVTMVEIDLLQKDNINKLGYDFDYIFHLAAIIGVQIVIDHSFDVLKNNMELLFNMIEFAKEQENLKRFVFASTSEVYAGTLKSFEMQIPTPENTPLTVLPVEHPRTSYMLSKIYGEAVMHQCGVPFTIIRPHNFYGPRMGMSHVIPELLKKAYNIKKSEKLEVFSVEHKRTFCYIEDAVRIIRLLAESEQAKNGTYNVGSESPEVTIGELAEKILTITGKERLIMAMPESSGSPSRRCPDMSKTSSCINYKAQVSLDEGIKKTFDWYKNNIFEGSEIGAK